VNWKFSALLVAGALGLGFWMGSQFNVRTETKVEERETVKKDVVTVIKTVTRPNGVKERTKTVVDRSKEKKDIKSVQREVVPLPGYRLSIAAIKSSDREIYQLSAERRLFGPYWLGISYNTVNQYGLSLGWEF